MITHYKIPVFWDLEYQDLDYVNESFNDVELLTKWTALGYPNRFTRRVHLRHPQAAVEADPAADVAF